MNRDHFWLTDDQFSKIEPHLPTDTRGKARVDDRRVISGIINVLRSGGCWIDAPPEYGPRKSLYNRYIRDRMMRRASQSKVLSIAWIHRIVGFGSNSDLNSVSVRLSRSRMRLRPTPVSRSSRLSDGSRSRFHAPAGR
jgi:transposase